MLTDCVDSCKEEPPPPPIPDGNENIPVNNRDESTQSNVMKKFKRKHYLSQQKQRKNNKNWKLNKFKRQQSEKLGIELINKNNNKNFDKNGRPRFNGPMIKFNRNILGRPGIFPILSKFFLPEKRPRKELIVPPTKFLLGGNISDPLNLNSLQNEDGDDLTGATPKTSPVNTPPKIEVIIPPNINDPLHLLDPVDAIEYQKQLISPMKKKKKTKHRNRNKKKQKEVGGGGGDASPTNTDEIVFEKIQAVLNKSEASTDLNKSGEKSEADISTDEKSIENRDKVLKELKLEFTQESIGRKRRISESHSIGKTKLRRMDSMDKIVSPVIPQPGAWKRLPPRINPSGAPRGGGRNRCRSQSVSQSEDNCQTDEQKKDESISFTSNISLDISDNKDIDDKNISINENDSKSTSFKKSNAKYQYGNYNRYYGYRNLNEFMDVRLKVFKRYPQLFCDKDILDIGCNAGHITLSVAKDLRPKTVTGIDIDSTLIAKGLQNLSLYVKIPKNGNSGESTDKESENDTKKRENDTLVERHHKHRRAPRHKKSKPEHTVTTHNLHNNNQDYFPISFPKCYGQIPEIKNYPDDKLLFPNNVYFKTCNYVLKDETLLSQDTQQYDLILCLSVTKWIHLNFGDAGLKLSFRRMFNQLRPGGKLVLEAQNWASYKKKKKTTEIIYNNYKTIEFFPNKFHEYLLGPDVGFSHSYPLGIPRHLSKGFKRPIQLYVKGDYTPSQIRWSDAYQSQTPYEPYRGIYAETIQPNKSSWGNETPSAHGNYSYRFTPSQNLSSTSQYYNPFQTDSYLPSYNSEIQKRQYCFASPLYSTVWSPPSRKSATHTPAHSVREGDTLDEQFQTKHVYPPTEGYDVGKMSNRTENDAEKSPNTHVYAGTSSDCIVTNTVNSSENNSHVEKSCSDE